MQLLIVRHAIAEDKKRFAQTGQSDAARPLTDEGIRKMKRNAAGLRALEAKVQVVIASPLTRARQTADIVAAAWRAKVEIWPELDPRARLDALLTRLQSQRNARRPVVIVGHEPHLSRLAGWLLTGADRSFVVLRKGGACLLEFPHRVEKRAARMHWALTPRQLRAASP